MNSSTPPEHAPNELAHSDCVVEGSEAISGHDWRYNGAQVALLQQRPAIMQGWPMTTLSVTDQGPGEELVSLIDFHRSQIEWKFRFHFASIRAMWSLQNFAHDMAAVLSVGMCNLYFVAIWRLIIELQHGTKYELQAKNTSVERT